jgi:hypothetical protein
MLTTLTLKRAPQAVRDPVAWFLPGGDAAQWLEEIAFWPAPEAVEFYLVAVPPGNRLAGALAVPPPGTRIPPGGRVLPFGQVAPRVFLPIDATLWPPVTPDELRAGSGFPVLIFHPAHGLVGCELTDAKRAWEFLGPSALGAENWSAARAAPPLPREPGAIRLRMELSFETLFGEESADIGSEAPETLPPSADEPSGTLFSQAATGLAGALVKGLLGLTSILPRTASAPTWVNALENWAQQKLAGVKRSLEQDRHRELHRLLDLLEKNPEEGLRYAIPLAALLHRGRGTPSARLSRRGLDFNLGRLGGGQAADFWNVPENLRASLAKSYREKAMRELKLGRHRRAARIFAELLGDFAAAADALKQGRHYREAALLYRERLRNPIAAADCFAEGGLLAEALAIYEEHSRWLTAADLYARLGDRAAEHAAVRRAVEAHRVAGDTLSAATLIETRLGEADEALALLKSAWPDGRQSLACLEESFALLERRQRPDDSRHLLATLAAEKTALSALGGLTSLLAKISEKTKDPRIARAAADVTRIKAAAGLAGHSLSRTDELTVLRALTRLAPEDRLLVRDTLRFRERRPKPPAAIPGAGAAPGLVRRITVAPGRKFSLPRVGGWARAVGDAEGLYAVANVGPGEVVFSRGTWRQEIQSASWTDPAPDRGGLFILVPHVTSVVLARPFAPRFELKTLPAANGFLTGSCSVGTPAWLPDDTVQAASSRFALWAVRVVGERVVLAIFQNERLVHSFDTTDELVAAGATGGGTGLALDALGVPGQVALGYGQHLLVRQQTGEFRIDDLGARILGLLPAPAATPGWVVLLERGAVFVSPGKNQNIVHRIDDQLEVPRGVFLGNGRLVLIGGEAGFVVRLQPTGIVREAWFPFLGGAGIALTPTADAHEFAIFLENGEVNRWRLPS